MYRIKTYCIMTLVSRYVSYRKVGVSLQPKHIHNVGDSRTYDSMKHTWYNMSCKKQRHDIGGTT